MYTWDGNPPKNFDAKEILQLVATFGGGVRCRNPKTLIHAETYLNKVRWVRALRFVPNISPIGINSEAALERSCLGEAKFSFNDGQTV